MAFPTLIVIIIHVFVLVGLVALLVHLHRQGVHLQVAHPQEAHLQVAHHREEVLVRPAFLNSGQLAYMVKVQSTQVILLQKLQVLLTVLFVEVVLVVSGSLQSQAVHLLI